jgi:hypothetical protein
MMAKKRKKMTPEERAEWDARHELTMSMLQERIDYYEAKIKAKEQDR